MKAVVLAIGILGPFLLGMNTAESTESAAQTLYQERCRLCHDVGVRGAPRPGNRAIWPEPTDENIEKLWQRARCGARVMPPMGTCETCTVEDLKAAIRYMIEHRP